jgi:hypothetical protein
MAFRVIPIKRLKGPQFKVLFERFENGRRTARAISKDEWHRHGFNTGMSLDEAKVQKDTLNQLEKVSRLESRRQSCLAKEAKTRLEQQSALPEHYRAEFEANKLPESKKGKSYWSTASHVIAAVGLPPRDWVDSAERFYKEFLKRKMSPSTVKTILPYINKWGAFYSRKLGQAFDRVPSPPRGWAEQIAEAHYARPAGRGNRESEPLTPEMLADRDLPDAELRWWLLSVWFGLRPIEVDQLSKPQGKRTWYIEQRGVPILWVYQTKLKGVKPEKRLKAIPAIFSEQRELLTDMSLPLTRPKSSPFPGVTLYGGRKGFVTLMKSKGQTFENVSAWLGHTDVRRTYQSYFNKQSLDFEPAA